MENIVKAIYIPDNITMSDKIYDIEENGKTKLDKIIKIIAKARVKASARSTDQVNNAGAAGIVSSHVTSPSDPTQTLLALPPPTPASPTTHAYKYASWAILCHALWPGERGRINTRA
jgi:hypothetical protein